MRRPLTQPIGGLRVTAWPEGTLVQAPDRVGVIFAFGQNRQRDIAHCAARSIPHVQGPDALSAARRDIRWRDITAEILMGLLVDGAWQEDVTRTTNGRFVRPATSFRNFVTADGSPGPSGEGGFAAERGRYHLYISLACPWAHRTLIFRNLKNLDDVISVSLAEPLYGKTGWEFGKGHGGTPDVVNGKKTLAEVYLVADPHYTGRVSVPVLWDKKQRPT